MHPGIEKGEAMGQFILGVLLVVAGVALFGVRRRMVDSGDVPDTVEEADRPAARTHVRPPGTTGRTARAVVGGAAYGLIGLGLLVSALSTIYSQDVGEAKVILTPGGTIHGTDTTPGFSVKAPWNRVVTFNTRNQIITMAGSGSSDGPAITAQTSDNATGSIDVTVRYSIKPTEVANIYRQYQSQDGLVERALDVDVRSIVRDVPVRYAASELRQQRGQVAADIQDAISRRWERLGVVVEQVDLRDIRYPQEIETSLSAIQTARSKVESARAELETAKIEAEKVKTDAQAQSDADQIIRCGATSTTVKEIVSGKEVNSIKVVPVPSANCQNRLNEQVLTAKYIAMLEKAAAGGNAIYVLPQNGATSLIQLPAPSGTTK